MQHMDLVAMAMPSTGAWGLMDLLVVFAMWAVMMVAMMVPSATPMLLTFATIARSRRAKGRAFVALYYLLPILRHRRWPKETLLNLVRRALLSAFCRRRGIRSRSRCRTG